MLKKLLFPRAEPHEYVAAWGARLALALFAALPLDRASALGGWIARSIGPRLGVHRTAKANLKLALPERSIEHEHILQGMWDNLGRVLAEYAHLGDIRIGAHESGGQIEVVGGEYLVAIRDSKQPAIFFSAHFGNWEVMSIAGMHYGIPLVQVYRAANNPLTEEILQNLRKPVGGQHVPKGMQAARELLKALKRNECLAMLVDQKLNTGRAVPFFGHDAMTAPAIAELALRTGCPIVPIYAERIGGIARFRVTIEAPMQLENTGDRQSDTDRALRMINGKLEERIRRSPEQWFWVHKRWKR
ncbi:MAG: lysophospholipid acyltransferase family protein [Ferrovibrio sp.]